MTAVFLHFFNLSITASWMVLAVLLLRLCLKRSPRWITCVLWGLIALRLVVPFTIESPVSLIPTAQTVVSTDDADSSVPVVDSGVTAIDNTLNNWLHTPVQSPLPPNANPDTVPNPTPNLPVSGTDSTPSAPTVDTPVEPEQDTLGSATPTVSRIERILQIAAPVWLAGIGLMLLYELISILRVRHRVLDAVRLRDNIWQSDRVVSPFIFGIFRPRIYTPYGLEESVLEQVLAHERAHLHRLDHWIKPFAYTLLAVYWYNPLLWVGYILLCRDIEVACDERVIRKLSEDNRRQYASALLECGVERRSIAACPLAFGEVSIKLRIKSVLNYRKPLLLGIIASLVICAVAAVCLLTVPASAEEEPIDAPNSPTITTEGYDTYAELLNIEYSNIPELLTAYRDLNGDGDEELLLLEHGTKLIVYTIGQNGTQLLVEDEFYTGTSCFCSTEDDAYSGLFYYCSGAGMNQGYYLSLDKVEDGRFILTPVWTEDVARGESAMLTDDKTLYDLSRIIYQKREEAQVFSFSTPTTPPITTPPTTSSSTTATTTTQSVATKPTELSHTHSYDSWRIVAAPLCTADGLREGVCSCGYTETSAIAAVGHTYIKNICVTCGAVNGSNFIPDYYAGQANVVGNETGSSPVAVQGDWLYFAADSCRIIKVRTDGTNMATVLDGTYGTIQNINVSGDWIYFYVKANAEYDSYIGKVRTDGTGFTFLRQSVDVSEMLVVKDQLFYTATDAPDSAYVGFNVLYVMPISGGVPQLLHDGYIDSLASDGYYLYFRYKPQSGDGLVFRIDLSNMIYSTLVSKFKSNYFVLKDGRLYYPTPIADSSEYMVQSISVSGGAVTNHGKMDHYCAWLCIINNKIYYFGQPISEEFWNEPVGVVELNMNTSQYQVIYETYDITDCVSAGGYLIIMDYIGGTLSPVKIYNPWTYQWNELYVY